MTTQNDPLPEREQRIIDAARAFARGETTDVPVVRAIKMAMRAGCGDNSCEFKKPEGMATNGGCRCWEWTGSALHAVRREVEAKRAIDAPARALEGAAPLGGESGRSVGG